MTQDKWLFHTPCKGFFTQQIVRQLGHIINTFNALTYRNYIEQKHKQLIFSNYSLVFNIDPKDILLNSLEYFRVSLLRNSHLQSEYQVPLLGLAAVKYNLQYVLKRLFCDIESVKLINLGLFKICNYFDLSLLCIIMSRNRMTATLALFSLFIWLFLEVVLL
ncbi:hypothetical protein FGO68_gene12369 [Halteria grandinella]|uniref:Transmembrane protein n=1 Tax=Halteria grandinella TaxID=5974 RepID=A0A8J8TAH4_HALGN|nr:hypothetical protein FGO68_gene12369 [Halteria grandinella]